MTILPIKLISETDQPVFGANLYNLAKLERFNLPVTKGIAVSPPDFILKTLLAHFEDKKVEVLHQSLEIIKKEILKITPPEELKRELKILNSKNCDFLVGENLIKDEQSVWHKLLEIWLFQISSRVLKEGFTEGINSSLSSQAVFIVEKNFQTAVGYFDPQTEDVIVKSVKVLSPPLLKQINDLVVLSNKKLFIPQIYKFILRKDKVNLLGLSPFTQTLPLSKEEDLVLPKTEQKKVIKSAVKIFLNLSKGFATSSFLDGVLIEGEKTAEIHDLQTWFDTTAFKLAEASLSFPQSPAIFKLPDIKDKEVRGTLRLLNHKSLFKISTDVFLFVKNKKNLSNIELAVPFVRSPEELKAIKKILGECGIHKVWVEMGAPENIINLEEYLKTGVCGIILNLDEMQKNLGGYEVGEGEFYKKQASAIIKFLTPAFKVLHKNMVPVLVKGELVFYHEVLDFLIEAGVFGVLANTAIEAENLPEQLSFAEKRMVLKKLP